MRLSNRSRLKRLRTVVRGEVPVLSSVPAPAEPAPVAEAPAETPVVEAPALELAPAPVAELPVAPEAPVLDDEPSAPMAAARHVWQLPTWLIEACGVVLVALIVNLWIYAFSGAPRCERTTCSFFESTVSWSLLLLALGLLVLGFMGLVPSLWELLRARRERRSGYLSADLA
jgi:hypothetical protein